jgi:hypothetical protein
MNKILKQISHIGDIFAIPGFLLLSYYFSQLENRSTLEDILFLFSVSGFIADLFFTYLFYFHF